MAHPIWLMLVAVNSSGVGSVIDLSRAWVNT
jgi:hypothetical protein